ncbi:MAG: RsmE family RNA methyltransferase [Pirellulales bacterium]
MSDRFFLHHPPENNKAVLNQDESHHCRHVLRSKVGDVIHVFDGLGTEWMARITSITRSAVSVEFVKQLSSQENLTHVPLTVAVALPKGERQKWLIEKLTELGTDQMVPLITSRGVAEATESARTRLERVVIEACKQCGRNTLMAIRAPASLETLSELFPSQKKLLAHPDGHPLHSHSSFNEQACLVAIGPEGGFTEGELAAADELGFCKVSLGPNILRIETAAVAVASWASQITHGT